MPNFGSLNIYLKQIASHTSPYTHVQDLLHCMYLEEALWTVRNAHPQNLLKIDKFSFKIALLITFSPGMCDYSHFPTSLTILPSFTSVVHPGNVTCFLLTTCVCYQFTNSQRQTHPFVLLCDAGIVSYRYQSFYVGLHQLRPLKQVQCHS